MNKDPKAKWLAALRSGEYKQVKGVLKSPDGCFCCLGVLTDVYAQEHGLEFTDSVDDSLNYNGLLSEPVAKWAGLTECSPEVVATVTTANGTKLRGEKRGLPLLNDHYDFDFNQIADLIEAQL